MKLEFTKNDKHEITVLSVEGESKTEFKYIDMINSLIKNKHIEEPELIGNFSESEKLSISSMINHINTVVSSFYTKSEGSEVNF